MKTGNASTVDCGVCFREIPLDAAFTPEGADYVMHFCGLDCYRRFTERAAHDRPRLLSGNGRDAVGSGGVSKA